MYNIYTNVKLIFFFIIFCQIQFCRAIPNTENVKCTAESLESLRELMMNKTILVDVEIIHAYLIPSSDAHQSEYVADHDKRLQYITNFTGSTGEAVVTLNSAAFWTDSRYHLQAEGEIDLYCWELMKKGLPGVPSSLDWLLTNLPTNATVGLDPFLYTKKSFQNLKEMLESNGHSLIGISENLVDKIWTNRPSRKEPPIFPLPIQYSGKNASSKINEILNEVAEMGSNFLVLTELDNIAWLLNLRGNDISYNPLFFSYVFLAEGKTYLFIKKEKMTYELKNHFVSEGINVILQNYDDFLYFLNETVSNLIGKIAISTTASEAVSKTIPKNRLLETDLVSEIKSIKNSVEVINMERAHIRDGLAMVEFLCWLNETIETQRVTEISAANKLYELRMKQDNFQGLSFETISAVGEHSAMPHYSPSIGSDKTISRTQIYLVDSGAHYWDGTTDVTRTVHFGEPSYEEKECFTRVLKGFIGVATSVFPRNTAISYFDNIARRSLWQAGLDYGHGTGHGIGMYLNVHEYPPLINSENSKPLQKNVFSSNEPGYYKNGFFGIRIEDIVKVVDSDIKEAFDGQGALAFESITYVPLQTKLIDVYLLDKDEVDYVNKYNQKVFNSLGPHFLKMKQMDVYNWLRNETVPIL